MSSRSASAVVRLLAGFVATCVATFGMSGPASAQSLFDTIFGGLRHAFERPAHFGSNDPFSSLARAINPPSEHAPQQRTADSNPSRGFCVRSCDGRYFPVQSRGNVSAADMCHAFCPTADTKLYSGSNIDFATTRDGSRYVDLDNAYAYRKQVVAGCTCNGRDGFGLAHVDVNTDPTLRPGDVVATKDGLVAYDGKKSNDFTPVQNYSGFSKSYRDQLSAMRIAPSNPGAPADITSSITPQAKAARAEQGTTGQSVR
jgi:hypothetical protein